MFDKVLNGVFNEPMNISCPNHGSDHIVWHAREISSSNGRKVSLPTPYCTGGDRVHALKSRLLDDVRDLAARVGVPTPFTIRVAGPDDSNAQPIPTDSPSPRTEPGMGNPRSSATGGPAHGDPLGIADLSDDIDRILVLAPETADALDRTRRHFERAPDLYRTLPGMKAVAQMRLSAELHGPPGTGKTESFRRLTKGIFKRRVSLNARGLLGSYVGETDRNMEVLISWVQARATAPGELAILLDDADDFLTARGDDNSAAGQTLNAAKISMLRLFDVAGPVAIVVTTNRSAALDPAIDRRFKSRIYFPLPDAGIRKQLVSTFLSALAPCTGMIPQSMLENLAAAGDGLCPAEIAGCVVDAVVAAGTVEPEALAPELASELARRVRALAETGRSV